MGNEVRRETYVDNVLANTEVYLYDYLNRLTCYSNTSTRETHEYFAWPTGDPAMDTQVGVTEETVYIPRFGNVVSEYAKVGASLTLKNTYLQGTSVAAKTVRIPSAGPERRHYVGDAVGTVSVTLNDVGEVSEQAVRSIWGQVLQGGVGSEQFKYAGAKEEKIGLYRMGDRMYDPTLGRFTQREPEMGEASGEHYVYAQNNPAMLADPTGRWVTKEDEKFFGFQLSLMDRAEREKDAEAYARIHSLLQREAARLVNNEPDPWWAFWHVEKAADLSAKVRARQMLPDSLPIAGNGCGDYLAAKFGPNGKIQEIVEWKHEGSYWHPSDLVAEYPSRAAEYLRKCQASFPSEATPSRSLSRGKHKPQVDWKRCLEQANAAAALRTDLAWPGAVLGWIAELDGPKEDTRRWYVHGLRGFTTTLAFTAGWSREEPPVLDAFLSKSLESIKADSGISDPLVLAKARGLQALRKFWMNEGTEEMARGQNERAYHCFYRAGLDALDTNGIELVLEHIARAAKLSGSHALKALAEIHLKYTLK